MENNSRRGVGSPNSQRKINVRWPLPDGRITITKPVTFIPEPRIVSARRSVLDQSGKCQGTQTHSFLAASCVNPSRTPVEIADLCFMVTGARCSPSTHQR